MKVEEFETGYYSFFCKGCKHEHVYQTEKSGKEMAWQFNEDLNNPTFTPSLLNTCPNHPDPKQRLCHLYVTNGWIQYLGDCSHDLAGQTIEMEEIE